VDDKKMVEVVIRRQNLLFERLKNVDPESSTAPEPKNRTLITDHKE